MTDNTSPRPLRAAGYRRVSGRAQAQHGTSPAQQEEDVLAFIANNGWVNAGMFEDLGVSGTDEDRAGTDRLLAAVRQGDVDIVVVTKLDRMIRGMSAYAELVGALDRHRVRLVSIAEAFDGSSAGMLQRDVLASFAAFDRRGIIGRTVDGRRKRAAEGVHVTGAAPFGHRLVRNATGRRPRLAVDDVEAATIVEAISMLVDRRMTTGETADHLNALAAAADGETDDAGEPIRRWQPRIKDRWNAHDIRNAFAARGDAWSGTWAMQPSNGAPPIVFEVPPIITPERHAQLRARMSSSTRPRTASGSYLLTSRIECECGEAMYGQHRANAADVYVCSTRGSERCGAKPVHAERIDLLVWNEVHQMLTDPERLTELAGITSRRTEPADGSGDAKALARKIGRIERALAEQVGKLLAAGTDAAVVALATAHLNDELAALRRHHQTVTAWATANADLTSRRRTLAELADRYRSALADPSLEFRRRIVGLLDLHVTVAGRSTCTFCAGRRMVAGERIGQPKGRHRCPACDAFGTLPRLAITGLVLEQSPAATGALRHPFTVIAG